LVGNPFERQFPEKFQFEKKEVRTADINSLLLKIAIINKGLQRNKKRDKSKNIDLSLHVLEMGISFAESFTNILRMKNHPL